MKTYFAPFCLPKANTAKNSLTQNKQIWAFRVPAACGTTVHFNSLASGTEKEVVVKFKDKVLLSSGQSAPKNKTKKVIMYDLRLLECPSDPYIIII